MNEAIANLLGKAAGLHLEWWLLAAALVLLLIDVFFPTDWPARLAYVCAALGLFLLVPFTPIASLGIGIGFWALMEFFHRAWWGQYLRNAPMPATESTDPAGSEKS
jgi:hypothetical protein